MQSHYTKKQIKTISNQLHIHKTITFVGFLKLTVI